MEARSRFRECWTRSPQGPSRIFGLCYHEKRRRARMGPLGVQEMIVIFLVALVLFGPKKLPELGKTIAKAMTEFRRAQSDLKATYEREMQAIERENESLKE